MKIIAIGRNYAAHAKELNNAIPTKPIIFLKPDTAVLKDNKPYLVEIVSTDLSSKKYAVKVNNSVYQDSKST